ncbi:MAG: terminase large subunit domain-containing protein [Paracoccaceae bacterium]
MSLQLNRQAVRWYPLIDIPEQVRLKDEVVRFKVVPAGRRSGKTERAKRYVAKQAMKNAGELYFCAAPTRDQVKKIFWDDMKALTFSASHAKAPSESDLKIFMPNGSEIHMIGLDKPQRIEGIPWTGGVIDEIADVKEDAWQANILPALNTVSPLRPDYRAWCWLIGVPDGLNHYYEMYQYALTANDPEWAGYHWKSSEILPPDVIASAKRVMSSKQFRQEFEASFETASGRIYEDYGPGNYTGEEIHPHEQLQWMHDQNFTPLSSAIGVVRADDLFLLDEIVLTSAVSRQSAVEFVERYKDHDNKNVRIYGDPAGRAGEKHGHASDYTEIEDVLRSAGWTFSRRVAKAAPAIKDRQNAVRAKICNAAGDRSLFVNTTKAPMCHKGLATVQLQKGSTFQEDQRNESQHITTAIGYMVHREWPIDRNSITQTALPF